MAVIINVNAVQQAPNSESVNNNNNSIIPSNAGVGVGATSKAMDVKGVVSTTGLFIAANVGKQAFNLVTSNIGKITGNSHLQDQVNIGLKTVGYAIGFATHPVITSIALGVEGVSTAINNYFEQSESKAKSAQMQMMAGTLRGRKY